jgi:hypothetical protein
MGGRGSGRRWYYGAADCTDEYRSLDVRRWQRDGLLMPGRWFGWQWRRDGETVASIQVLAETDRVTLSYRHRRAGEDWKSEEYPVGLSWTPCTFGGQRAWFTCPAAGCGRRVAILYGGSIFACRHCYRLVYRSQRESIGDRAARRAEKIRARLGWEPGILNGRGDRPKGMHGGTFERLTGLHDVFLTRSLVELMQLLGIGVAAPVSSGR